MKFKLKDAKNLKKIIDSFVTINTGLTIYSQRLRKGLTQSEIEIDSFQHIDPKNINQFENFKKKGTKHPSFITDMNMYKILNSNLELHSKFNLIFGNRLKNLELMNIIFIALVNEAKIELNDSGLSQDNFTDKPFFEIYTKLLMLIPSEAINLALLNIYLNNNTDKRTFLNKLCHYQIDQESLLVIKIALEQISVHSVIEHSSEVNSTFLNFFINLFGWDFYELLKKEFPDDDPYTMRVIPTKMIDFLESTFFPHVLHKLNTLNNSPLCSNGKDIELIIKEIYKIIVLLDLTEKDSNSNTVVNKENTQYSVDSLLFKLNMLIDNLKNYLILEPPFEDEYFYPNFPYIQLNPNIRNIDTIIKYDHINSKLTNEARNDWNHILENIHELNALGIDLGKASKKLDTFINK